MLCSICENPKAPLSASAAKAGDRWHKRCAIKPPKPKIKKEGFAEARGTVMLKY